ncbi:MAG: hypothetical protein IJN16_06305 [Lachnospiraceae bacterium]|nr:hypothetical protein [Lachnospiraceae bacterium]
MEQKLLVLCDPEEDYAQHMADFLRKKKEASWEILVYTKPQELVKMAQKTKIEILLISESAYGEYVADMQVKLPVLLNESGMLQKKQLVNIDKYQAAEKVRQELLAHYMEMENDFFPMVGSRAETKLIGLFSPVRRCLQTTFGLTYGQLLAEKHRTLYLSLEPYAGWEEWGESRQQDISSLLYYQQEEGFPLHMQTVVRRMGNLEYVTSMVKGENLLYITVGEWQKLLRAIVESGVYEYVILDLSECMQGLFEILRMCNRVYTIVREDAKARSKLEQYEQLLALQKYEDVWNKTSKCRLPVFHKLPEEVEQYTKGELAEYIKGMLRQENG